MHVVSKQSNLFQRQSADQPADIVLDNDQEADVDCQADRFSIICVKPLKP